MPDRVERLIRRVLDYPALLLAPADAAGCAEVEHALRTIGIDLLPQGGVTFDAHLNVTVIALADTRVFHAFRAPTGKLVVRRETTHA